jgi:hypothetical protein
LDLKKAKINFTTQKLLIDKFYKWVYKAKRKREVSNDFPYTGIFKTIFPAKGAGKMKLQQQQRQQQQRQQQQRQQQRQAGESGLRSGTYSYSYKKHRASRLAGL